MAGRVGLGPVFGFEWLLAARRWQVYGLRALTVLLLFAPMSLVWMNSSASGPGEVTIRQSAEIGKTFYELTGVVLLGLVGLAAPAATAGAICQDKARGNLTLLFATDLSDAEIVLGKLAARLVPVLGLILCAAPVMAIATLFGGIDPVRLVGAWLVVLACAIFGCSLALTLSVWGTKTHEVLLTTYVFGILYLLTAPIYAVGRMAVPAGWLPPGLPSFQDVLRYNPIFLVLAAVNNPPGMPPVTIGTQLGFLGLGLTASATLIAVATWRIRPVVIGQLGRAEAGRGRLVPVWVSRWLGRLPWPVAWGTAARRAWPRPSLDRNPVFWRECQRRRWSRWSLVVWGAYVVLCASFSAYGLSQLGSDPEIAAVINAAQVGGGLLLLSVSAATSLAEERQRGSLDVLMATPLSTRSIVWGKWRGAFRGVPPLLILPTIVTAVLAYSEGNLWAVPLMAALILSYGAAITSLGLALATWMPRMSRAVATTVGLYIVMTVAWIPFSFILFGDGPADHGLGVAAGSPLVGVGGFCAILADKEPRPALIEQTLWTLFWTFAYAGLAAALLLATLATFNRCLGRVDDPTVFDDEGRAGRNKLRAAMPDAMRPAS